MKVSQQLVDVSVVENDTLLVYDVWKVSYVSFLFRFETASILI